MSRFLLMDDPFVGNIIGIVLVMALSIGNRQRFRSRKKEYKWVNILLIVTGFYCIVEFALSLLEGTPGKAVTIMLYIMESLLYSTNMFLEFSWLHFIDSHVGYPTKGIYGKLLYVPILGGVCLLIYNLYNPCVFAVADNYIVELKGAGYFVFFAIAILFLVLGLENYYTCLKRGGVLKFFPVWMYLVPVIMGMLLETVLNDSFIGACNAVALGVILLSLRDEDIYRDNLTGLYNRSYLEAVKRTMEKKKNTFVSGIMIDLNDFKSINDNFGHAEGDKALIASAEILTESVGSYGEVIRYAGDEFIVILNTWSEEEVKKCLQRVDENFDKFNEREKKPYKLSASAGYAAFNTETQTVSEFLNVIDRNMYENKQKYYCTHTKSRDPKVCAVPAK